MKLIRNKDGLACSVIEKELVNLERAKEIAKALCDSSGRIYPVPFSFIKKDTLDTLNMVMQAMGLYTFPTLELCEWLNSQIDDDPELEPHSAIEICAGTGWIGRQLGIPITDIKNMDNPIVQNVMAETFSVPTIYADDTEQLEAMEAVKKYSPEIVIGSFVTSRKRVDKKDKRVAKTVRYVLPYGGNIDINLMDEVRKEIPVGVDVESIIRKVYKVILVVNTRTHLQESYFNLPHQTLSFPWLVTRGDNSQSRIIVFENKSW